MAQLSASICSASAKQAASNSTNKALTIPFVKEQGSRRKKEIKLYQDYEESDQPRHERTSY